MRFGSFPRRAVQHSLISACAGVGLMLATAPGAGLALAQCLDEGATNPGMVRIQVIVLAADGSASIDGDNILFDNEADLRAQVSINGGPWMGGRYIEGDDTPHFADVFETEVPRALSPVPIRIRMSDRDFPDADNWIDLDPAGGCNNDIGVDDPDCTLELFFNTCCYSFTGDGAGGAFGCPGGACAGGADGHWLGPGDAGQHAAIQVAVRTGDRRTICTEADVFVESAEFVQVVDQPGFAVGGRGSILRVTFGSTFPGSIDTSVLATIGDQAGPDATELRDVTLDHCDVRTENFFVPAPVVVEVTRAHYGAQIDPDGLAPWTDPCVRLNDGNGMMYNIPIRPARDLSVLYQRIHYLTDCPLVADCGPTALLQAADAATEAGDANVRMRGFFPAPELFPSIDPLPLPLPAPDIILGPRTEIQVLSEVAALLGLDRVVGLVPFNWVDAHAYIPIPLGTVGVSNGKIGPHFVIAERIPGELGFTPVHELGHTFGLSDEPCSVTDAEIWSLYLCEDEYNGEVFPGRPGGGFQGRGFDVPSAVEAAGTCFMDNDTDAWITNNDFESFVRKMEPGRDPRVLVVTGNVTSAAGGGLLAAVGLDEGIPDRNGLTDSPFSLVVRDSAGATLGQYGIFDDMQGEDENHNGVLEFDEILGDDDNNGVPDRLPVSHPSSVDADMNGIPDAVERAEFALRIPWHAATASVALVGPGGAVIDTVAVDTGGPPLIELLEPLGDVRLDPAHADDLLIPVRWRLNGGAGLEANGAIGPMPAAATVQGVTIAASYDGGATWYPRAHRVGGNAFVIDAHGIATPLTMQLRVLALVNGPAGIDATAADSDQDRCPDPIDPFPMTPQTADADGDGIPDACDRCSGTPDPSQTDADQDGYGDACDGDYDQDGLVTAADDSGGFQPCMGQNVVLNPACYDRDFDGDGIVDPQDRAAGFAALLARGMPGPSAFVPDADSDGVGDAYDCAPGNPTAWKMPGEMTGLMAGASALGSDHVVLAWDSMAALAGPGTVYDIITGSLSALKMDHGYLSWTCLTGNQSTTSVDLFQAPPSPADGRWYLARAENACGRGLWVGGGSPDPSTVDCALPAPALAIQKSAAADPVPAGGLISYSLAWQNSGNATATGVVIADTVPTGTTFVTASGGGTPDPSDIVHWSLGTVPAGASGVVQLVVRAPSPATAPTTVTNAAYSIDSNETAAAAGAPVTTTVVPPPIVAIDLDPATPTTINSARTLSLTTTTLDVGVIVSATGTAGFGDIARIVFGVINAFNTGGATVTSITPLAITDLMAPAVPPNNATFAALAGEFQFGNALVERGVGVGGYAGPAIQFARFRITFGTRPAGSTVRVFVGDAGPGTGAVLAIPGMPISGDTSADGTPVGGVAGSDQGAAAGINYMDATITFGP